MARVVCHNEWPTRKPQQFDLVGFIIEYENGALDLRDTVEGFARLIASGAAWSLQGSYGRTAADLISAGFITREGVVVESVLCENEDWLGDEGDSSGGESTWDRQSWD